MNAKKKSVGTRTTISLLYTILFLLPMLSCGVEFSVKAQPASIIVSPSESVQAAINNATAGGTILVLAGTYHESLSVNKSISLIGENRDQTIIDGQNNQIIINITVDNVNLEGFKITSALNPSVGISMSSSKGCVLSNNIVENSQQGIALTSSNNNTISNNIITANTQSGISIGFSNNNIFFGNVISGNSGGITVFFSGGNVFSGNTFASNYPNDEAVSFSNFNTFYHNNFYDSVSVDSGLTNSWNSTFEGNYWSNYTGHDSGDGIGIEYFDVAAGNITRNATGLTNVDQHPLMGAFSSFDATLAQETYQVSIISNSTVSDTMFEVGTETGNKIIQYNVTGMEGTVGFSRIAIPTGLMNASVTILAGEREIVHRLLPNQNAASKTLYFTYPHSNQTILIISSATVDLYNELLNTTSALNATYNELLSNYMNLLGNYSQLQQNYMNLNNSYQQHLIDYGQNLQNVRSLMYIFAAATAVLIVTTIYFSKRAYSRPIKTSEEKERF